MTIHAGVRAHDFGKIPLEQLATEVASRGLCCVQFAAPKSIPGLEDDAGRLSSGLALHVRDTLAARGIHIAVLGCYINLADPDENKRRHHLSRFKAYLRLARDFGCSLVGTETGSLHSDFSFHPENHGEAAFQRVLASVRELVREAERFGTTVAIEAVERYVIHDPKRLSRLVDEVDSPNIQVILDPVNLLSAENFRRQDEIIEEAFSVLGERIAVLHAKDAVLVDGVLKSVPAGQGQLNYPLFFRHARRLKPGIDVLLEDTQPATLQQTVDFVSRAWQQA